MKRVRLQAALTTHPPKAAPHRALAMQHLRAAGPRAQRSSTLHASALADLYQQGPIRQRCSLAAGSHRMTTDPPSTTAMSAFGDAIRAVVRCEDLGHLTARQLGLLAFVITAPPPHTTRHAAAALKLSKSVISRSSIALEELDLVERVQDPDDARSLFILPTRRGRAVVADVARVLQAAWLGPDRR